MVNRDLAAPHAGLPSVTSCLRQRLKVAGVMPSQLATSPLVIASW
ncbi:hypothetical protein [Limosilactobacillus fermentum]|nr:hypothetical protein [Limosilactobacillus fermentum]UUC15523.1 hypothetical protein NOV98_00810 [Limosilactobacillus fermentum]